MGIKSETLLIAGALVLGALAWVTVRGAKGAAQDATAAVIGAAGGVATGAVLGVGDVVGVPRTNQDKCAAAIAAGRTWDASFDCPAGTFLGYLFG